MNFCKFFQTKTKARRAKNQFRGAPKCFRSNPYNYCPFHKIQNLQNAFSRKMDCPHNTWAKKIFVGRFTNYRRLKVKNAKKGQKRRLFDFSGAPFFVFSPNYPGFRPSGPFPTTYIFFSFFARIVCEKGPPRRIALIRSQPYIHTQWGDPQASWRASLMLRNSLGPHPSRGCNTSRACGSIFFFARHGHFYHLF